MCKRWYSVTNIKCEPNIICYSLEMFWGITELQCTSIYLVQVWFVGFFATAMHP